MSRIVGVHVRETSHTERRWNGWWKVQTLLMRHLHATKGWRVIRRQKKEQPVAKTGGPRARRMQVYETYKRVA